VEKCRSCCAGFATLGIFRIAQGLICTKMQQLPRVFPSFLQST
jgi:hypothetical protein